MAKKKTTTSGSSEPAAKKKSSATKASGSAAVTPAGKQTKASAAAKPAAARPAAPLIDTSLAAQAAAQMLLGRQRAESDVEPDDKKGSLIQQLKADLNKSHTHIVSNVLDKNAGAGQKRPNLPFGRKQVGHNQTFGPDLTRSGVPRRTSG